MSRDDFSRPQEHRRTFEEIILGELPVLYRVAKRFTSNEADAEDLVGQALLLAVKAWSQFDGRHPRSWLLRILRNEYLGRVRAKGGRNIAAIEDVPEPSDEGFWEEISWRAVGADILTELDGIPEEYRMAVVCCDIEEMTYEEAAIVMEVAIGTVRSRLFRGRRLLRSRLVAALGNETMPESSR